MRHILLILASALVLCAGPTGQQSAAALRHPPAAYVPPDLGPLIKQDNGELRQVIQFFAADRGSLFRFYDLAVSPLALQHRQEFFRAWRTAVDKIEFDHLQPHGRVDYILLRNKLDHELREIDLAGKRLEEVRSLLPFAQTIIDLKEARQRVDPLDTQK